MLTLCFWFWNPRMFLFAAGVFKTVKLSLLFGLSSFPSPSLCYSVSHREMISGLYFFCWTSLLQAHRHRAGHKENKWQPLSTQGILSSSTNPRWVPARLEWHAQRWIGKTLPRRLWSGGQDRQVKRQWQGADGDRGNVKSFRDTEDRHPQKWGWLVRINTQEEEEEGTSSENPSMCWTCRQARESMSTSRSQEKQS